MTPFGFLDALSNVFCREGGAPVGGGGGGGRAADVGDNVGLPSGICGKRFSGESCDISSDARYELRFDGGKADGVLGEEAD